MMLDAHRPEVHVRRSGTASSGLAQDALLSVARWVSDCGGGFSRIDVQASVPCPAATGEQFMNAIEQGAHVTRVHQAGLKRQLSLRRSEFDRLLGPTRYVGSPTSRRRGGQAPSCRDYTPEEWSAGGTVACVSSSA